MAMATHSTPGAEAARTLRKDAWWVQPVVTFAVLSSFVVYATFRVLENQYYVAESAAYGFHYATPFGNPDFTGLVPGLLLAIPVFGPFLGYPGVLILPFVAGFRFTCYYYRKAYYRSFAFAPPGCAVPGTTSKGYQGERGLLVVQNLHRYFLYAALVVLLFNFYDMARSIVTPFGLHFGLGSGIMVVNVALLSAYTLGCHSFRHLVGGKLDCYSCDLASQMRYGLWSKVTVLNGRHMLWAWVSLVWVAFTDFYIRWVASSGVTHILGVPV